ncbi:putative trans-sialidase [Leptomonas pyrrhocoris]|uniref:Putative trans-sialidase n=1 Tax=Leptomonas pyrrhocoris TaxID=157538 RepID=A0A0N0DXP7_LEPPY|nr:putative trans-sialidase [Leptomonas pyrrhocoris]XP_015662472.1 putative trans-sialidase [Leptomonas pyrrhocoris]KPA83228.1 putative trans-sialidase [Leptomonas pyrrhocoris]KPA84033.1 putative trans-sialidase [Leptomonas pyrrhocoris]|eukprot:XP_015661667.1 putative trans-sialidase [Leptomonas pyrrhocoris]
MMDVGAPVGVGKEFNPVLRINPSPILKHTGTGDRLYRNELAPQNPTLVMLEERANEVAHRRLEKSTWEQLASIWRMFEEFCDKMRLPAVSTSVPLFLESRAYKGSTKVQYSVTLRTMLDPTVTALDQYLQGMRKVAATEEVRHAVPLTLEDLGRVIAETPAWRDKVVWRLAWITASRWAEIAGLTTENLLVQPEGDIILDWGAVPKASKSDPYRSSRYVWIKGQDAADLFLLKTRLGPREPLTTMSTSQAAQKLKSLGKGYTAHSIKGGAVKHAMRLVYEHNLDWRTGVHLMKHKDPRDHPSASLRYMGETVVLTNDVHRLTQLM